MRAAPHKGWTHIAPYPRSSFPSPGFHSPCMENDKMSPPAFLLGWLSTSHSSGSCLGILKISVCCRMGADRGKKWEEDITPSSRFLCLRPCPGCSHTFCLCNPCHNQKYFLSCCTQKARSSENVKRLVQLCLWVAEPWLEPRDFWFFPKGLAAVWPQVHRTSSTNDPLSPPCISCQFSLPRLGSHCPLPLHTLPHSPPVKVQCRCPVCLRCPNLKVTSISYFPSPVWIFCEVYYYFFNC